jgi:hypothetical protein
VLTISAAKKAKLLERGESQTPVLVVVSKSLRGGFSGPVGNRLDLKRRIGVSAEPRDG